MIVHFQVGLYPSHPQSYATFANPGDTFALKVWQASLGQLQRQRLVHDARRARGKTSSDARSMLKNWGLLKCLEYLWIILNHKIIMIHHDSSFWFLVSCAAKACILKRFDTKKKDSVWSWFIGPVMTPYCGLLVFWQNKRNHIWNSQLSGLFYGRDAKNFQCMIICLISLWALGKMADTMIMHIDMTS